MLTNCTRRNHPTSAREHRRFFCDPAPGTRIKTLRRHHDHEYILFSAERRPPRSRLNSVMLVLAATSGSRVVKINRSVVAVLGAADDAVRGNFATDALTGHSKGLIGQKPAGCLAIPADVTQSPLTVIGTMRLKIHATRGPTCASRKCCDSCDTFLVLTALTSA